MITITSKGDLSKTYNFLKKISSQKFLNKIKEYGEKGVEALSNATPVDTGKTAASWSYKVVTTNNSITITWTNSNVVKGVPIAIILQYGHGTRNGGWVEGRDYINPAIQPIFDEIKNEIWREVTKR